MGVIKPISFSNLDNCMCRDKFFSWRLYGPHTLTAAANSFWDTESGLVWEFTVFSPTILSFQSFMLQTFAYSESFEHVAQSNSKKQCENAKAPEIKLLQNTVMGRYCSSRMTRSTRQLTTGEQRLVHDISSTSCL